MSTSYDFESILADDIRAFLKHKRALGKQYLSAEEYLRLLDRFLVARGITRLGDLTSAVIDAFLAMTPYVSRVHNAHIGLLSRLFEWLVLQERFTVSPVRAAKQPNRMPRQPFIFSQDQARRLLELAVQLPPYYRVLHRGETYHLAFALMYGLGLRVGEVARLCRQDVDFERQVLTIRETKFSKSRWVPFGPKLGAEIRTYMQLNASVCPDIQPIHPLLSLDHDKKRPLSNNGKVISRCFHQLIPLLELTVPPGVQYPRAHHLRHSFAVATLLRWYRQGIHPAERLIYLAAFMGHVDPASTAVYLTITADLLQQANERFERFAAPALKEVTS